MNVHVGHDRGRGHVLHEYRLPRELSSVSRVRKHYLSLRMRTEPLPRQSGQLPSRTTVANVASAGWTVPRRPRPTLQVLCLSRDAYASDRLAKDTGIILRHKRTKPVRPISPPMPERKERGGDGVRSSGGDGGHGGDGRRGLQSVGGGPHASDALFLNMRDKTHTWPFSAIAEVIHNSSDARATEVRVSLDNLGPNEDKNFVVVDNGSGMTHQEMLQLFTLGKDYGHSPQGERIGCNGVGFKQGVLRLGDTAVVVSVRGECKVGHRYTLYCTRRRNAYCHRKCLRATTTLTKGIRSFLPTVKKALRLFQED